MKNVPLHENENTDARTQLSPAGFILIGITGGAAIGICTICLPFVSPALRRICLPYVPATTRQVKNVMQALKGRGGTLVDLGSGDGRIVFAAARHGFRAHGVELNPWLIAYSRYVAFTKGLSSETKFFREDLWNFNLEIYENVVIFGVEEMMDDIEQKMTAELRKDSHIVACRFPLRHMTPKLTIGEGVDTVWVYKNSSTKQ